MPVRSTDVLVIGGGMTGAGVLRDLAIDTFSSPEEEEKPKRKKKREETEDSES